MPRVKVAAELQLREDRVFQRTGIRVDLYDSLNIEWSAHDPEVALYHADELEAALYRAAEMEGTDDAIDSAR